MDLSALSDDELGKLAAQTAPAPAASSTGLEHLSDDELSKLAAQTPPPPAAPDQRAFVPAVQAGASGIWGSIKNAAAGAAHAVAHPIDTANDVGKSLGDTSLGDVASGAWRAARSTPLVGGPLSEIPADSVGAVSALKSVFTDAPNTADADVAAYKKSVADADLAHAKEHPLTDFIQRSAGMGVLPQGIMAPAAAMAMDTFQRSYAAGNSPYDAMRDARNVSALVAPMLAAGKVPGVVGRGVAKELGVSQEAMARYRADPEAVNDAAQYVQDPEQLKNLVDAKVAPVNQAVSDAEAGLGQARQGVTAAQQAVADTRQPAPFAADIPAHLDQQGAKLQGLSGQAFDILEKEGKTFTTGDLVKAIDDQMGGLKTAGIDPGIGPDSQAFGALQKFRSMVQKVGAKFKSDAPQEVSANGIDLEPQAQNIPAPVIKEMIQTLDSVSKAAYETNAGELGPQAARQLAKVRRTFDQTLKQASPDYAAKMAELAPQVQLTSEMSKVFGDEGAAIGALKAAADPTTQKGFIVRQMLKRYDAANGTNFSEQVADYYDKPRAELGQAQSDVDTAQQTVAGAQDAASNVSKLGPNSTENVIKSVQGGRNFEARKQLDDLDPTLSQTVQDTGVARQFSRPTTNGSRRTVFGAAAGAAVGNLIGAATGHAEVGRYVGGAVGSGVGFIADKYGGQAVKAALDAGLKLDRLAGSPYLAPIMEAAQRSPIALAAAHYMLSQKDPNYQKLFQEQPAP